MKNFTNQEYNCLAEDVVHDAFKANSSYRGRIAKERQYAEIIVRKILDINPEEQITLGKKDIKLKIQDLIHSDVVENALNVIQKHGNLDTHTQNREEVTEDDYIHVTNSLFDLLAYLPIRYFEKYEFGSRSDVVYSFSFLPPIIRYKVLKFLYEKYPNNIHIIDKYSLVILKAFGIEEAIEWLKKRKEELDVTEPTIYDAFIHNIERVSTGISSQGILYRTFEEALPYYQQYGILKDDGTAEVREFNDLMEFLFLGRIKDAKKFEEHPASLIFVTGVA